VASLSLSEIELDDSAWEPRVKLPPSEWVEESIYIDGRTGSVPGYYSHSRFPYSRAVLDCFANPRVEKIIMDWATQLGKTTNVGAKICWVAENDPSPTMIGCANEAAAKAHYKRLLEPALESVDSIRKRLPQKTKRRWQIVDLEDMFIFYAWPGSKATISDRPIKYLFVNEISLWKAPMGAEGDPIQMIMDRTKAFPHPGRKIVIEGKPTIEGECRLTNMLNHSRKHVLHVPCPLCGEFQPLYKGKSTSPGGIKWVEDYDSPHAADKAAESVYWECEKCEAKHTEEVKLPALRRSKWVPEGCTVEKGGVLAGTPLKGELECGFHLNSLYSTIATWRDFAKRWVPARERPADLQAVVNGWLAETWKVHKRVSGREEIEEHRDEYASGTIPGDALGVYLTIDVQEDCFYYVVRAWSWLATSWLVRDGMATSWAELEEIEETTWPGLEGELHGVTLTTIDSAFRTTEVYTWCAKRPGRRIPIRGEHQYRQNELIRVGKLPQFEIDIWHIDAGQIRDQFYDVRLRKGLDEPGAWSFGSDVRADYVRAIAAWERREKLVGLQKKMIWVSNSPGFEHKADCEFQQEAIAFMLRLADKRNDFPKRPLKPTEPKTPSDSRLSRWGGIRRRGG
jgi:phage terminase large subunit GpA-like protein